MKNWAYAILSILVIISVLVYRSKIDIKLKKDEVIYTLKEKINHKNLISSREPDRNPLNRILFDIIYFFQKDDYKRNSIKSCFSILENEVQESGNKALKCFQYVKSLETTKELEKFRVDFSIKNLPVICKVKDDSVCEGLYDSKDGACVTTYKHCSEFSDTNKDPPISIYFLSIQEKNDLENEEKK